MKPKNYKLQIARNILFAMCFIVLDIYYWCQVTKDRAIWILAVEFAIFTIARIVDIIHDIIESRVVDNAQQLGKHQEKQNRLSFILDCCGCASLIACFIFLYCIIFGK